MPALQTRAMLFQQACRRRATKTTLTTTRHSASSATNTPPPSSSLFSPSHYRQPLRLSPTSPNQVLLTISKPPPARSRGLIPSRTITPTTGPIASLIQLLTWSRPPSTYVPAPFTIYTNPYRARKTWPPVLTDLHPKQQFHFEKTYRRRLKLAHLRPAWVRGVKMVQYSLITAVLIYFVFICEPDTMGTPFDGFRKWFFGKMKDLGNVSGEVREEAARLELEAAEKGKTRRTIFG